MRKSEADPLAPILSRYGEPPTAPDIDPDVPGAPAVRLAVAWRVMNATEALELAWPGSVEDWP